MIDRKAAFFLVSATMTCICATSSWGCNGSAQTAYGRDTLKGIQRVAVVVEQGMIDYATMKYFNGLLIKDGGPTDEQTQAIVEYKLRQAGIEVIEVDESMRSPRLYVNLTARVITLGPQDRDGIWGGLKPNSDLYVHSVAVSFRQPVTLPNNKETTAVTWHSGDVGYTPQDRFRLIEADIELHVDNFVNDYLAVNPKQ